MIDITDVLPSYILVLFAPQTIDIAVICLTLTCVIVAIYQYFRIKRTIKQQYSFLEVTPAYNSMKSAFSTNQLFKVIHSIHASSSFLDKFLKVKKTISCEIVSTKEKGIRYILRVSKEDVPTVKKSLLAYVSSIQLTEVEDYAPSHGQHYMLKEFKLTKSYIFPLQDQSVLAEFDPIAYVTAHMTKLDRNELLSLQIVTTPILSATHGGITDHIHDLKHMISDNKDISSIICGNIFFRLFDVVFGSKKKFISQLGSSRQLLYKTIEDKINQPLFETTIRLLVLSNDKNNSLKRIRGVASSFDTFTSPSQSLKLNNTFFSYIQSKLFAHIGYFFYKKRLLSFADRSILSVSELGSIYHFPYTITTRTEDLVQNKSPELPAPLSFKKTDANLDIVFAHNTYGNAVTPIGLTLEERQRHMYAIGATGTGKTTLLLQMIYQDIVHGKGLAVIDPHGDLIEKLLGVIPKERIKDVVYFNPYDIDHPVGLNVMELSPTAHEVEMEREKDLIVSSIVSIFHKLYPARYSGPRMEHILRNTILTALALDNPTLFTVYKLLTNVTFRKQSVSILKDTILKEFWKNEFEKFGSFQRAEQISPITNKLGRFLTTSMTRRILSQQKSKLNFDDIMNNRKILLCDLSKGKIGEDTSSFLGSLIIAKLELAALKRIHIPQSERTDFFFYIDEFQNFATLTFAQILSEARKYRLNTILAHQTISQIEDKDLLKVILANVGTIISFRTSNPGDEDMLLPLFTPQVHKQEISNLPSYHFYIKVNALTPQDSFSGSTTNFIVENDEAIRKEVIEYSRNTYGKSMEDAAVKKKTEGKKSKPMVQMQDKKTENRRVSI
jgi:hypothetical protein